MVNLATEPVTAKDLAREVFGVTYECSDRQAVRYDLRTRHALKLAGRDAPYLRTCDEVLASISGWVDARRKGASE